MIQNKVEHFIKADSYKPYYGYDFELKKIISHAVNLPFILNCGSVNSSDFNFGINGSFASVVALNNIFSSRPAQDNLSRFYN